MKKEEPITDIWINECAEIKPDHLETLKETVKPEVMVIGGGMGPGRTAVVDAMRRHVDDWPILVCDPPEAPAPKVNVGSEAMAFIEAFTISALPCLSSAPLPSTKIFASPGKYERDQRNEKECLLPGCTNKTGHNGGYCSADHCREHRALMRRNK